MLVIVGMVLVIAAVLGGFLMERGPLLVLMQDAGLRQNQVSQVRGYADQKLRLPLNPLDPSNRRISLIVQYLNSGSETTPASSVALK